MKIGGRVSFDRIEELERNFAGIDFPIELALPWRYIKFWLEAEDRIDEIISFFGKRKLDILSIHATQGRISEPSFLKWGSDTIRIAEALNCRDITVHPNIDKKNKPEAQNAALTFLKDIQKGHQVQFSVETFGNNKRVFTPDEIMEFNLPMTLDVSHVREDKRVLEIIEKYSHNIPVVHLSSRSQDFQHYPVDDFCIEVLRILKDKKWQGNVILEYMPWHHYRIRDDIKALNACLLNNSRPDLLPVDDRYKDRPEHYGYNVKVK